MEPPPTWRWFLLATGLLVASTRTMSERTTAELIETLGADVDRCHGELIKAIDAGGVSESGTIDVDYEYYARQLIRAIFAFIEAVTFSMKVQAAAYCLAHNREISDGERLLAVDTEHFLTSKGAVSQRSARIRLADNIRFAFVLQERALGLDAALSASVEWWSCLKASIKVRDRLTHPKLPGDVDVTADELVSALKAYNGFKKQVLTYAELRPA